MSQFHRTASDVVFYGRWHTLIEHHHDVRADDLLRLDAALRTQLQQRVIDIAAKFGVILPQGAAAGQREYLKAAGVRQYRAGPVHEAVDSAEFSQDLHTRLQHQVVG